MIRSLAGLSTPPVARQQHGPELLSDVEVLCLEIVAELHEVRVFFPLDEAVAGATLSPVCPRDGQELLLELESDEQAEAGLRAVWTDLDDEVSGR